MPVTRSWQASATALLFCAQAFYASAELFDSLGEKEDFRNYPAWLLQGAEKVGVGSTKRLEPRQEPGAECQQNNFLKVFQAESDAAAFCSGYIDVPAETAISVVYPTTFVLPATLGANFFWVLLINAGLQMQCHTLRKQ